jgi:hypothetical protein
MLREARVSGSQDLELNLAAAGFIGVGRKCSTAMPQHFSMVVSWSAVVDNDDGAESKASMSS